MTCRRPGTITSSSKAPCPFIAQLLHPAAAARPFTAAPSSSRSRHTATKSRSATTASSTAVFTAATASDKAEAIASAMRVTQYLLDHHAYVDVLDK